MSDNETYDVCLVGDGSGGKGAAVSAARDGAKTLLIEAPLSLGGTSTWAGVNNYEPAAGATGLPQELYERLAEHPYAESIQRRTASYHPDRPWGIYDRSDHTDYRLTLNRRCGTALTFEPKTTSDAMIDSVKEAGVELRPSTRFIQVQTSDKRVQSIDIQGNDFDGRIQAGVFIDSTADIYLARAAGRESAIGVESRNAYDEPIAPEQPESVLNNASLCYRIAPLPPEESLQIDLPPDGIDLDELRPVTSIRTYANGYRNMNPLHLMTGQEAFELGYRAYEESEKRIKAHWHPLQTRYGFERWKMTWVSPMLGIRDTHRLAGEHVLTEHDVETPLEQTENKEVVTFANHGLDFHDSRSSRQLVNGPYGIHFRCLLPREYGNLLVACRGASLSSIGASTCRLSRTMIVLGQAVGTTAALWGDDVKAHDASRLRETLKAGGSE